MTKVNRTVPANKVKRIPYMGSKNKIASWVLNNIVNSLDPEPGRKYDLVDAFGGGGSISTTAVEHYSDYFDTVTYNELNPAIYNLFTLLTQGTEEEHTAFFKKAYEWVSREQFNELKDGTDAYAGYIQSCWSFGNNQNGYFYGVDIEETKKLGHDVVVEKSIQAAELLGISLPEHFCTIEDIKVRRLIFRKAVRDVVNTYPVAIIEEYNRLSKSFASYRREHRRNEALIFTKWFRTLGLGNKLINAVTNSNMAGHYTTLASQPSVPTVSMWEALLPYIKEEVPAEVHKVIYAPATDKEILKIYTNDDVLFPNIDKLDDLKNLQTIEYLLQIEQLQSLASQQAFIKLPLSTSNLTYEGLKIEPNQVVYCDAPYIGTAEYKEGGFNKGEYYEWLQKLTEQGVPVFVSEYNLDIPGYMRIAEKLKGVNLSSIGMSKMATERLYWNGNK